jgi:hypothetical protein
MMDSCSTAEFAVRGRGVVVVVAAVAVAVAVAMQYYYYFENTGCKAFCASEGVCCNTSTFN